jgi:hypothetical protein
LLSHPQSVGWRCSRPVCKALAPPTAFESVIARRSFLV